jgi:putative ABC transport system permease protein
MFKSYIKLAFKVLARRKFFTFVSLSGITFTITVLIIAAAFLDHMMSPARPGTKFDRTMFVERIELQGEKRHIYSSPSYAFLDRYARSMETPEAVSILTRGSAVSVYRESQRIDLDIRYTDEVFWDILEFDFLEGKSFGRQAVDNADYVAVISEKARRQVFGDGQAVGRFLETTEGSFRVLGVIPKEDVPTMLVNSDIYVPITTDQESLNNEELFGDQIALVLASDRDQFAAIKEEFAKKLKQAHADHEGEYEVIKSGVRTQSEAITEYVFGSDAESSVLAAVGVVVGAMLLFMLFPALNLINLNITRIMERASEIGVRKAFGASSLTLVGQFMIENIVITLIGGGLAWALSWSALWIVTGTDAVPYGEFRPSAELFLYCLLICLAFGFISGAYPAYRMSKMQPVAALRGVES